MNKLAWYSDADYVYKTDISKIGHGTATITFYFPNAAAGSVQWSTWLYRFEFNKKVATNMEAEMLMCYIDMLARQEYPATPAAELSVSQ